MGEIGVLAFLNSAGKGVKARKKATVPASLDKINLPVIRLAAHWDNTGGGTDFRHNPAG